jgi:hypothetical protein
VNTDKIATSTQQDRLTEVAWLCISRRRFSHYLNGLVSRERSLFTDWPETGSRTSAAWKCRTYEPFHSQRLSFINAPSATHSWLFLLNIVGSD